VLFVKASSPNVDSYVFVKVINDVAGIVIEEEAGDAGWVQMIQFVIVAED